MRTAKVRDAVGRDAAGRDVFIPWYPLSRTAYVVPSQDERAAFVLRSQRFLYGWAGVLVGVSLSALVELTPSWWRGVPIVAVALAHWAWWTHRATRGLERTRYEPAREA
jgi:hypothetical protein